MTARGGVRMIARASAACRICSASSGVHSMRQTSCRTNGWNLRKMASSAASEPLCA